MVLAFVGAGLMSLQNALGVVFGANLGTTFTGWLVATLGFKLSGPRFYNGEATDDAWVGYGNPNLTSNDIRRALRLFWWSCGVMAVLVLLIRLVF